MAKHDKRGRTRSAPPFVMVRHDLLDSAAWRSLKPTAQSVYIRIARRYNGKNNGFLAASVRDLGEECDIKPHTAGAAINALIDRGFLERAQEGNFSCKVRLAAEYRLTSVKCDRTGAVATDAFKKWKPDPAKPTPKETSRNPRPLKGGLGAAADHVQSLPEDDGQGLTKLATFEHFEGGRC